MPIPARVIHLVVGASLLPAGAQPAPARPEPIVVAVEDAAAPWSERDGSGYANDVVRAAFAASHVAVTLRVVPYARCKRMVLTGETAACFSMSREAGLEPHVAMSAEPLLTLDVLLVARRGSALAPRRDGRLPAGTRVGVVLDYEYPHAVRALAGDGSTLDAAPNEETNLRKLALGRIDAAVVNVDEIRSPTFIAAHAGVDGHVASIARLGRMPAYVGFSRAHPDGMRARVAFDAGLRRIRADGRLRAIKAAWTRRTARAAAP